MKTILTHNQFQFDCSHSANTDYLKGIIANINALLTGHPFLTVAKWSNLCLQVFEHESHSERQWIKKTKYISGAFGNKTKY